MNNVIDFKKHRQLNLIDKICTGNYKGVSLSDLKSLGNFTYINKKDLDKSIKDFIVVAFFPLEEDGTIFEVVAVVNNINSICLLITKEPIHECVEVLYVETEVEGVFG